MSIGSCQNWVLRLGALALSVTFLLPSEVAAATRLKLALVYLLPSPQYRSAALFADRVNALTGDQVKIELMDQPTLGREQSLLRMTQSGELDFALVQSSLAVEVEAFRVFDLPYLVRDRDHAKSVANSFVLSEMAPYARKKRVEILAMLDGGFRQVNSRKPLYHIEDFEGLNIGILGLEAKGRSGLSPIDELFYSLGAQPVGVPLSEVHGAAGHAYLDAVDTSIPGILESRSSEPFRFVMLTNHIYTPIYLIASSERFQQLDPKIQEAIRNAASEAQMKSFALGEFSDRQILDRLASTGVQVISLSPEERKRLEVRSRESYDRFALEFEGGRELLSRVLRLARRS
jgi:TRAP-type transport system periplasmic protein